MTVPFGMLGGNLADDSLPTNSHKIEHSAQFDRAKKQHILYTPKSGGSLTTWTLSFWFKLGSIDHGAPQILCNPHPPASNSQYASLQIDSLNAITFRNGLYTTSAGRPQEWILSSNSRVSDVSAWYHLVIVCDTNNADEKLRYRMYLNGKEDGVWLDISGTNGKYPTKGHAGAFNSHRDHALGMVLDFAAWGQSPFDGRMTDLYFIDNAALHPEEFGYFDNAHVWQPKPYETTLKSTDYHMDFSNNNPKPFAATHGDINVRPVSMGIESISLDSPTNNIVVFNKRQQLIKSGTTSSYFKNANTVFGTGSTSLNTIYFASGMIPDTGSYYFEYTIQKAFTPTGLGDPSFGIYHGTGASRSWTQFRPINGKHVLSQNKPTGPTVKIRSLPYDSIIGSTVGVLVKESTVTISVDGIVIGQADVPAVHREMYIHGGNACEAIVNMGDQPFKYPPRKYDFIETVLTVGTGNQRHIDSTVVPDLVLRGNRKRDGEKSLLYRDGTKTKIGYTSATISQNAIADSSSATIDDRGGFHNYTASYNMVDDEYVGWCIKQNPNFKIVKYSGDGSADRDVAHNMGTTPSFVIIKCISHQGNWTALRRTSNKSLRFNTSGPEGAENTLASKWSSSTINLRNTGMSALDNHNTAGREYVMFAFSEHDEHVKLGEYTTSTTQNVVVNTGFAPKFVMIKSLDQNGNWVIFDTTRKSWQSYVNLVNPEYNGAMTLTNTGFVYKPSSVGVVRYMYLALGDDGIIDDTVKPFASHNYPELPISKPKKYFSSLLYNGDGHAGRMIQDLEFKPDLIWIKSRTVSNHSHLWFDSQRGWDREVRSNQPWIESNDKRIAYTTNNGWKFASAPGGVNDKDANFISYAWKKSPKAGFDVVKYTGNSTNDAAGNNSFHRELAHDVGGKVEFMLVKGLERTSSWYIYHKDITDPKSAFSFSSDALGTGGNNRWGDLTKWSATHVSLGNNYDVNKSGEDFIAYMWRSVPGFSQVGTYVGTGTNDGPYLNLGFKPAFIMVKRKTGNYKWEVVDTARWPINGRHGNLNPGTTSTGTGAWGNNGGPYSHANGYKLTNMANNPTWNGAGEEHVFIAFAEAPFNNSTAR